MDERLAALLDGAAKEIARVQDISLEEAVQIVREGLPRLRAKYSTVGAPYGDTDAGFAQWLITQALK